MKHLFLVDDEKNIRDILRKFLEKSGYLVTEFVNGDQLVEEMNRQNPDLIVLDIMMPGLDGLELCKKIRKSSDIPVVFITARGEEIDKILGLELGADDYLSKPFSPRELVLRINNIFKRLDKPAKENKSDIILSDLRISCSQRRVEVNGTEIKMTLKEYDLFEYLAENRARPFTREQLLDVVWGYEFAGNTRIVDDVVKRLRKKLRAHNSTAEIVTAWGFGYSLKD